MTTVPLSTLRFDDMLGQIAAKTPAPGGGAVAGACGALAGALAEMVIAYSVGKKSLAEHKAELERAGRSLRLSRHVLMELADEDAQAFAAVSELMKLPEGDARRERELSGAVAASIQVPLSIMATALELLRLCGRLTGITNPQLKSDLAVAAVLAEATVRAGWHNVAVNVAAWPKAESGPAARSSAEDYVRQARELAAGVEAACGA